MSCIRVVMAHYQDLCITVSPAQKERTSAMEDVEQQAQHACSHGTLRAQSGGYYLACSDCRARWVAIKNDGSDTTLDYERAANTSLTSNVWYCKLPRKVSFVGAPAIFALELACQPISDAFDGFGCYLVSSALLRPDWRDVDVRFIMSDDEFDKEFPGTREKHSWEFDSKWLLMTTSISGHLSKATGLPIDFQFQPQTYANKRYAGQRHPLGIIVRDRSGEQ